MSKKNKKFLSDLNLKLKYCFNKKSLAKNNIYLKKQIKHLKNTYLDSGRKYVILKNLSYEKDKIIKDICIYLNCRITLLKLNS